MSLGRGSLSFVSLLSIDAAIGTRIAASLRIRTFDGVSRRPRSGVGVRVPASQVAADVRRGAGA